MTQPAEPAAAETPESVLLARVDLETIQNALEKLPVKFREIILLCDLEEMSYQEIGETLGIPIGNGDVPAFSRPQSHARTAGGEITGGFAMTCDPWRDKLDAYVDGDGSQEELAGLEAASADLSRPAPRTRSAACR